MSGRIDESDNRAFLSINVLRAGAVASQSRINDQTEIERTACVMAKLQFKTSGFEERAIELRPGKNRLGRAPDSDILIEDPTVSSTHCELVLGCNQLSVRDCCSTNGTFVDGTAVGEAKLFAGQILRLGDVELLVKDTEVPISIPTFKVPVAAPPVVLFDGSILCRRHRTGLVSYRCGHCGELLCEQCIHRLRRRGGNLLLLCPLCSYRVEPIGGEKKRKQSLLNRLRETTKLFFRWVTNEN